MFETALHYFDLTTFIVGLIVVLTILYIWSYRPKNLPPSPGIALPIIGHLYLLDKDPRKQLHQWSGKYGDIFSLQMGPWRTAFVNTFEAMKEAFIKKGGYFSDRPTNSFTSRHIPSFNIGVAFSSGHKRQMQRINYVLKASANTSSLNFLPILYYLPFDLFKGKQLLNNIYAMLGYTAAMVQEIKKNYDPENLDNYIVAYIDEMKKEKEAGRNGILNETSLSRNIDNLFIAGSETTSTTILWCLLYAINYPDVQNKIFEEILEQVGTERVPSMTDKPKLKYLTAFIMEVQRKASIGPLSLPHLCNTTIAGFDVPKGTIVMPHLDAVLHSKTIWGDPENFRPERFLDEHGNILKREELIPFSIGRRICLGESLAKMELFLYLATLFQKFEFLPSSPYKVPPLTAPWGGVIAPDCSEFRCVERVR